MAKSRYLRHPRTTQEFRQEETSRENGVKVRAKRRRLPTTYDDIPISRERSDKGKNHRRNK